MNRNCRCGCKFKQSRKKQKQEEGVTGRRTRVIVFCSDCDINCVYDIYDWEAEHEDEQFLRPAYEAIRKIVGEGNE